MGQLIAGIAGAAISTSLGLGPGIGWSIGIALGAPTQKQRGPQLNDLKVYGTEDGAPIPYVFGHPRVAAYRILWVSQRRATDTTTSEGKGGGVETTTTSYSCDIWFGLTDNGFGVDGATGRRIWLNGKLVWTNADISDADSIANSDAQEFCERITWYDGGPDQMPDPTYEAAVGTENAVAYRRRGSVFMQGLQLGGAPALIPNFTFEWGVGQAAYDILDAPLTADAEDISTDPASVSITRSDSGDPSTNLNYSPLGVNVAPPAGMQIDIIYSGAKLNLDAPEYDGRGIVMSVEWTPTAYGGTLSGQHDSYKFMAVDSFDNEVSWMVMNVGDETHIFSEFYHSGSNMVDHGPLSSALPFRISFDADGATYRWIHGDDVLRTESGARTNSTISLHMGWPGNYGVTEATFRNFNIHVSSTPATLHEPTLREVMDDLCLRAGLNEHQFDNSALDAITKPVRALAISQVGPTRTIIEMLQGAYFFESYATDKYYSVPRGGAAVVTIPWENLGAGSDINSLPQRLALKDGNDLERPCQTIVTARNVDFDYQNITQESARLSNGSETVSTIDLPMGFKPEEVKGIAETITLDANASRITTTVYLLACDYPQITPTTVYVATARDGSQYRLRGVRCNDASRLLSVESVLDDASVLVHEAITSVDYTPQTTVNGVVDTEMMLIDGPKLRDSDPDNAGILGLAKPVDTPWPGAVFYSSDDGGASFSTEGAVANAAIFGDCLTTLGDWTSGRMFDEVSSLRVDVGDAELASTTRTAMLADPSVNACAAGDDGRWEFGQFRDAEFVSAGVYDLTGWLRGARGTERASAGHGSDEKFALIRVTGARRIDLSLSQVGVERSYKAVTQGRPTTSGTVQALTGMGVALKPFAPTDLRKEEVGSEMTVTWHRRSRLSSRLFQTATVPLGEASEAYDVELYDGSNGLVSTTRVTQPEWSGGAFGRAFDIMRTGYDLRLVGGDLASLRASSSLSDGAVDLHDPNTGVVVDGHFIGEQTTQLADDDTYLFVATVNGSLASHLFRFDPGSMGSPTHTYSGTLAADCQGVAYDGTNVWVSEFYSGRVRKLSASDLSVSASTTVGGAPARIFYDGAGSLWVCAKGGLDIVQITTSTGVIAQRIPVGQMPFDVLVANGIVFVQVGAAIITFDAATGAQIASHSMASGINTSQPGHLAHFGSNVVGADIGAAELMFIDDTTGLLAQRSSISGLLGVSGVNGSDLFVTAYDPVTALATTSAYGETDLTGHSVTVYQISDAIGRGYPATLEL